MKKIIRILGMVLLLTLLFNFTACGDDSDDEDKNHVGTYEAVLTFAPTSEPNVKEITISAKLTLNKDGGYVFETMEQNDFYPCYVENGKYTLDDKEITLVPDACQEYNGGDWRMKTLTAEEQTNMTTKGTLKNKTFTATMRWHDSVWDRTTEMKLKYVAKHDAPAASPEHNAAKGTYTGEFAFDVKYGNPDRPAVNTYYIAAKLVLDRSGTYTFSCGHAKEYRNITYRETGTYTLSGDEITLIPNECMFKGDGGAVVMQTLTAEEQASMTVKGTIKDGTVTATMRWLYNYHSVSSEMQLVREPEQ